MIVDKKKGMDLKKELEEAYLARRNLNHYSIYDLGQEVVGKKCHDEEKARNEYSFGKFLKEKEVRVPEIFELVQYTEKIIKGEVTLWFIVMERIKGKNITDLRDSQRREAERQYRQELEKVLDLGICPEDSDFGGNSLFCEERDRLYLIDFEFWHKTKNREELSPFYERIRRDSLIFWL